MITARRYGASPRMRSFGGTNVLSVPLHAIILCTCLSPNISCNMDFTWGSLISLRPTFGMISSTLLQTCSHNTFGVSSLWVFPESLLRLDGNISGLIKTLLMLPSFSFARLALGTPAEMELLLAPELANDGSCLATCSGASLIILTLVSTWANVRANFRV